jgi:hypothetical protein
MKFLKVTDRYGKVQIVNPRFIVKVYTLSRMRRSLSCTEAKKQCGIEPLPRKPVHLVDWDIWRWQPFSVA